MFCTLSPQQIQNMGSTRRWHTRRVGQEQNLLEHSAAVALLALHLAGSSLDPLQEADLLRLALIHDAHEAVFGDIPRPAKEQLAREGLDLDARCRREFHGLDPYLEVDDAVLDLVEVADLLEAALWAQRHAPDIADLVSDQAADEAQRRLTGAQLLRAMQALGIWAEVEA